jgi:hypothetical protein
MKFILNLLQSLDYSFYISWGWPGDVRLVLADRVCSQTVKYKASHFLSVGSCILWATMFLSLKPVNFITEKA